MWKSSHPHARRVKSCLYARRFSDVSKTCLSKAVLKHNINSCLMVGHDLLARGLVSTWHSFLDCLFRGWIMFFIVVDMFLQDKSLIWDEGKEDHGHSHQLSWTILLSAFGTRERRFFIQPQLPPSCCYYCSCCCCCCYCCFSRTLESHWNLQIFSITHFCCSWDQRHSEFSVWLLTS